MQHDVGDGEQEFQKITGEYNGDDDVLQQTFWRPGQGTVMYIPNVHV